MASRKFIANGSLEGKNSPIQPLLESNARADFKATSDFRLSFQTLTSVLASQYLLVLTRTSVFTLIL